jgi:hypothetical protein
MIKIQLIDGTFSRQDATDLLTQLIQVKIRFHEGKIEHTEDIEDIKMRENKIKHLQDELHQLKQTLAPEKSTITLFSEIDVE